METSNASRQNDTVRTSGDGGSIEGGRHLFLPTETTPTQGEQCRKIGTWKTAY
ncbi:hypothetical protein PSDVSF_16470 [Pseudodesulfovibrio sediminis]|uniref:Uncharacterized protein n=1 Tax=Pseudodesulfovibrio sediminis TaxID=2810563 RepID=A0ABN6ET48_9BACT|nr:hypothetical protein PSDVSF_16470 [Pseudodesulfovibrio sediminis]